MPFRPSLLSRIPLVSLALLPALTGLTLAAEGLNLQTQCQRGDLSRVSVSLDVQGTLIVSSEGKRQKLPMKVAGSFAYDEMRLDDSTSKVNRKAARFYASAEAEIQIDKQSDKPALRDDRRLVLVTSGKNGIVISSASGPFTRDELELIDVPGNSLFVDGILPEAAVQPGDSWKPEAAMLAKLLGLDVVAKSEVQCTLAEPKDAEAGIDIKGKIDGATAGVATEIDLTGRGVFDLDRKRLVSIQLRIKERRAVGFVSPGLEAVTNLRVEITPLAGSEHLSKETVADIPGTTESAPPLALRAGSAPFQLMYDRRWHITHDEPDLTVLRLVDRGELVAQCNISPMAKLPADVRFTLDQFQEEVQQALGKNFGRFEAAAERKTAHGLRLLRVVVEGTASELPIQWRYYLAIDSEGRRVAMTFTLESTLVDRFADADAMIIESLEIGPGANPETSP